MRRINSSTVSVAISMTALFVALGGTALAVSKIGTSQLRNGAVSSPKLKNGAVTSAKLKNGAVSGSKLGAAAVNTGDLADSAVTTNNLADGAVTTGKLADNAVTSAKVLDGSLTAGDVAANTFLAANGTAADSSKLGGQPASAFVAGSGHEVSKRLSLPSGQSAELLELDFGHIEASCAGSVPTLTFTADLPVDNVVAWSTKAPSSSALTFANALSGGGTLPVVGDGSAPESVTWQAAFNGTDSEKLATAWTTQQNILGTCVFTGQALTTL
jgi:hypothetical protein